MRHFSWKSLVAGVAALLVSPGLVSAAEFNFKLAHYLPPTHNHAKNVLPKFAEDVERDSGGRIKITIYPAEQLLKVNEIFDGVKNGVADMGWSMPGVTPGRFPVMNTLELPFLFTKAEAATAAIHDLYQEGLMKKEFQGVRVLWLHTHHAGGIHARSKPVASLEDIKGMRIRFPSPAVKSLLEALGAVPVGVPAPQAYESLEKGTLDGVAFPFDAMQGLRLGEQAKFHTDFPLYVLTFYLVMNERSYGKLPDDLKKVIDKYSGRDSWLATARSWDQSEVNALAWVKERGNTVVSLSPAEKARWMNAAMPKLDEFLAETEKKGVPARTIYNKAKELADRYAKAQ